MRDPICWICDENFYSGTPVLRTCFITSDDEFRNSAVNNQYSLYSIRENLQFFITFFSSARHNFDITSQEILNWTFLQKGYVFDVVSPCSILPFGLISCFDQMPFFITKNVFSAIFCDQHVICTVGSPKRHTQAPFFKCGI